MGPYYHWGSPTIGAPAGLGAAGGACGIDEDAERERYESEAEEMRIVNEAVNRVLEEPEGGKEGSWCFGIFPGYEGRFGLIKTTTNSWR